MKIGIVGGGISGLGAAQALATCGHSVELFETKETVGGLAASFELDGSLVEQYYHFVCVDDHTYLDMCQDFGIGNRIRWNRTTTGFFYKGRVHSFTGPVDLLRFNHIPLSQRVRCGLFALATQWRAAQPHLDSVAAETWIRRNVGEHAYDVMWHPLLHLKFADDYDKVSMAWLWHRVRRASRCHNRFGYIEGGTAAFLNPLIVETERNGGRFFCNSRVNRLIIDESRVVGFTTQTGEKHLFDHVILALPMPHAAPLLPSSWESYAAQLARIEYTAIACVVLKLRRPLTPHFWLNVHDEHIPFNGVIEFSNLNPQCAGGDHLLYVPYYTPLDSTVYAASDSALLDSTWECLRRINPTLKREDLLGYGIFRDPCAQPICPVGFSKYAPHCHSPIHGLHFLESTFLYPEDRSLSGLLAHARSCAQDIHAAHLHG